jgi:hypothetical protein
MMFRAAVGDRRSISLNSRSSWTKTFMSERARTVAVLGSPSMSATSPKH